MKPRKILFKIEKMPRLNILVSKLFNLFGVRTKISGNKNQIDYNGAYLYKTKIIIKGHNNLITIGKLSKMKNNVITINGSHNNIQIGSSCFVNNTNFSLTNGSILLGNNTTINSAFLHAGEKKSIQVGEDCMFSSNIDIRTTDSHSIIDLIKIRE